MKRVSDSDLARLGERLRALREELGLSQKEVAARLEMTEVGYGHFERGRRLPSAAELPWLARGLGVSTEELLTRLGLIDQRLLDGPVPEAIAGRLARIVANYEFFNKDGKDHIDAIMGLASDFGRNESVAMRHDASQSESGNTTWNSETDSLRRIDKDLHISRVFAFA